MIITPTTFDRCDPKTSSDCVIWVSGAIPCLGVCQHDTLTEMQAKIAQKVCDLITLTDASTLVIPACFAAAFASKDKTVLNFLQVLLDTVCTQASQLTNLQEQITNVDPLVTLDYKCCSGNPCVNDTTVHVSEAIQNVINCLCTQNTVIANLQNQVDTMQTEVDSISTQFTDFINNQLPIIQAQLDTTSTLASSTETKVNCVITSLNNQSIPISC